MLAEFSPTVSSRPASSPNGNDLKAREALLTAPEDASTVAQDLKEAKAVAAEAKANSRDKWEVRSG
jgi:hypothetical protein